MRSGTSSFIDGSQGDVDVLRLREGEQLLDGFLAADSGLLVAAEGHADIVRACVVDPDVPRLDAAHGPVGRCETRRADRGRQAMVHGVDCREHVGLLAPFQYGKNRTKDLLARNPHVRLDTAEDSGLDEETLSQAWIIGRLTAGYELGTFRKACGDVASNACQLSARNHGAHRRFRFRRNARLVLFDGGQYSGENAIMDRLVEKQA